MIHQEAKDWAEMLLTPHLAALNEIIARGDIDDIIRVNEALHEKKIAYIADTICNNPNIRVVLDFRTIFFRQDHLCPAAVDPTPGQRSQTGVDFAGQLLCG